ncbi:MAG: hypothetical protein V4726_22805 [Verrucomicrobiota bacterium]
MKTSLKTTWLPVVAGVLIGTSAAFGWQALRGRGPDKISSGTSALSARTEPGRKTAGAAGEWESLLRKNGHSLASQLRQAELAARAGSRDMPRLLELAGENRAARELLLRRWTEIDPRAAAAWLGSTGKMKDLDSVIGREGEVQTVYSVWAKNDPAAAMASLKAHSGLNFHRLWTASVLEKLLDEDMAAGVKFGVLSGPGMSLSRTSYRMASPDWVQKDPARAAALLAAEAPGGFRDGYLGQAIEALAKTDLTAAVALLNKHQDGRIQWVPDGLFSQWAAKDPGALTAYLDSEAPPWQKNSIKAALARSLGEKDPVAALQWASENLGGGDRAQAQSGLLAKLTKDDPAAALSYLNSLSEGTALRGAVEHFTGALTDSSPEALLTSAQTLPEGAARSLLTARAYEKWYQKDPGNLLAGLASQPVSALPDGLWTQLGQSTTSTADGLKYAAALPAEAMPEFLKAVFRHNIQWYDTAKFTSTLAGMTDPAQRAAAIEGAMENLTWLDPAPVTVWARGLSAGERGLVADQMTRRLPDLTAQQKKELIDPLR